MSWLRRRSATAAVAQAVRKLVFGQEFEPIDMVVLELSSDDHGAAPDWLIVHDTGPRRWEGSRLPC